MNHLQTAATKPEVLQDPSRLDDRIGAEGPG